MRTIIPKISLIKRPIIDNEKGPQKKEDKRVVDAVRQHLSGAQEAE